MPTRTLTPGTDVVERALVVDPGQRVPGRAAGFPLRREGPAKLTGEAKYTDDLVFPGAWYGTTIRSTEPRAKLDRDRARPRRRLVEGRHRDGRGHPGREHRQLDQGRPAACSSRSGARFGTSPSPSRSSRRRIARRSAGSGAGSSSSPRRCRRSSTRRRATTSSPSTRSTAATSTPALPSADLILEGEYRVGHQEQLYIENNAMIAVPGEDGGVIVHGSLQCPYYVHKALKRALKITLGPGAGHPGGDRRRVRRQGGVPVGHRPARLVAGAQGPAGRSG